jgi:pyridoxamine 5'-phosphate oxidase
MNKQEILEFITKNPTAYVATAEDNIPHVRPLGTYQADENGIIFSMQANKDVYKQLAKNPNVEICYFVEGVTIRVVGTMTEIDNTPYREEMLEKRPFLKPQVEKEGWDYIKVLVIKNGKATVMDMKGPPPAPGAPKEWVDL